MNLHAPRKTLLALAIALPLAALAAKEPPLSIDPNAAPGAQQAQALAAGDLKYFKGAKRVAISNFQVEFVTVSNSSASATEIGRTGTASVHSQYKLVGVTPEHMRAIADKLYSEWAAELTAAGFEVVPQATLTAHPLFQKLAEGAKTDPVERSGQNYSGLIVGPSGLPVWGLQAAATGGGGNLLGALAQMKAVTQTIGNVGEIKELNQSLQAVLLNAHVRVNFVEMASSSSSFLGRISGEAKVTSKLQATVPEATLFVMSDGAMERIGLARPLIMDGEPIKEVREVSTAGKNLALAALSLAIGKGGSASVSEREAVAEPEAYSAVINKNLGAVRAMWTARLAAQR